MILCARAAGLMVPAANIAISRQTVKMLLAGLGGFSVEQRCAIAGELLDTLSGIPTAYIAAVSAPMVCLVSDFLVADLHSSSI